MAVPVLDVTIGGSSANSFATVEQANAYFSNHLYGEFWEDEEPDTKARALITATRLIVEAFMRVGWQGFVMSAVQRLPFPRYGLLTVEGYAISSGIIPTVLVEATAEYAGKLIQAGQMPDAPSATEGIKKLSVGPIDVEWSESVPTSPTELPETVYAMISFLAARPYSKYTVPLVRV
jgi:hypothetical protein